MTVLETERLLLRPLDGSDAEELFKIQTKGETMRYLGGSSVSVERIRDLIERGSIVNSGLGLGMWAVILKITGQLVGRCGLFNSVVDGQGEAELSYLIDPEVAGNGFATEASSALIEYARSVLGVTRIVALISPENTASIRVAEKLGFYYEAQRSEASEFGPTMIYAIALS